MIFEKRKELTRRAELEFAANKKDITERRVQVWQQMAALGS